MADFIVDSDGVVEADGNKINLESLKGEISVSTLALKALCWPNFGFGVVPRYLEKKDRVAAVKRFVERERANELRLDYKAIKPDNRIFKPKDGDGLAFASSILGTAMNIGLIKESFSGLLCCNVDLSQLAMSKDGFFRGFCLGEGGITKQAKFAEVPGTAATPLIAFQVASFVTGLYYQHIITERLDDIKNSLNQIQDKILADDLGKIKAGVNALQKIYSITDGYREYDYKTLDDLIGTADALRNSYRSVCNKPVNLTVSESWLYNKKEAEGWLELLRKSRYLENIQVALHAEILYYGANAAGIHMEMTRRDKSADRINNYMKNMDCEFGKVYNERFHEIKSVVCKNLSMLCADATMYSDDIKNMSITVDNAFYELGLAFQEAQQNLAPVMFIECENGKVQNRRLF